MFCTIDLFCVELEKKPAIFTENEENVPYDPQCESKVYYSEWSPCYPKCKNSEYEKGKRTKTLKFRKGSYKECAVS